MAGGMNIRKATQQTSSSYPANGFLHHGIELPQEAVAVQIESAGAVKLSEEQFYSLYHWSLNPALTIQDLLQRFREELDRFPALEIGWQREECKINLYLFTCAIACSIDSCMAEPCSDIDRSEASSPTNLEVMCRSAGAGLHSLHKLVRDTGLRRWRHNWAACVEGSCEILIGDPTAAQDNIRSLQQLSTELLRDVLPRRILTHDALLPACLRSGDVTHQDVLSLARLYDEAVTPPSSLLVVGVGPAGAFFAPLISACLKVLRWRQVSWMTTASHHMNWWEQRRARQRVQQGCHVLLTPGDFDPSTSLASCITMLQSMGVAPENVTVAGARLSSQHQTPLRDTARADRIRVITLEPDSFHKRRLLDPKSMQYLIGEYLVANGWQQAAITAARAPANTNAPPAGTKDSRLEQIFSVHLSGTTKKSVMRDVSVTSAGWGWLGYHSYIAATRLNGFVPKPLGLRSGFLFAECSGESCTHDVQLLQAMPKLLGSYVAARTRRLRLDTDTSFKIGNGHNEWNELAEILSCCYHPAVRRLKRNELLSRLRSYTVSVPTLVDGNIGSEQWVHCGASLRKTGFDYYSRNPEMQVADPAWDLAAATFEFSMTPDQEQEMLQGYVQETGDTAVGRRILLYKLLYGSKVMWRAADDIAVWNSSREHAGMHLVQQREPDRLDKCETWNRRFQSARDFLVFQMNRFSSGLMQPPQNPTWSKFLLMLDLDGVFDCELLGFPHTTWSGLQALTRLQSHGYSVILNAGRSIRHVRNYCESFGIPGGIAEYGSVFFDAVRQCEIPLIDARAIAQLDACRRSIQALPGVFIDPGYQYAIRAYRYHGRNTVGLPLDELTVRWNASAFDRLTLILKSTETYVIPKGSGKGPASIAVRKLLGLSGAPTAAVGDSGEDAGMLEAAQFAYAPANCSQSIRQLAIQGKCRIMRHPFQRGLLDAVLETLPAGHKNCNATGPGKHHLETHAGLISALLDIADRSLISQLSERLG